MAVDKSRHHAIELFHELLKGPFNEFDLVFQFYILSLPRLQ